MKTLTKLCGTYIIVVCALLTLAWVAHLKRTELRKHFAFLNTQKLSNPIPIERRKTDEQDWQRILAESNLPVGFSYSQSRTEIRYVLGVPTVHRKGNDYLMQTLKQLIGKMNKYYRRHCLIVVFIGETDSEKVERIFLDISDIFGSYLDDGLISVISPPPNYYPDFESLYITLNDKPERAHWRTKQNLDYMFLMTYAQSRGDFYLQLEDDIIPNDGYLQYIDRLASMQSNFRLSLQTWIVLSLSDLGFIGKLFHTEDLKPFLAYVKIFYNDQPIDWLLQSYVKLKSCRWNAFHLPHCVKDYFMRFIHASQSQFQHIGLKSSLREKVQERRDLNFNRSPGKTQMNHLRQPMNLILSHMSTLLLEKKDFKQGETFIWGYMPQESSLLRYMKTYQNKSGQIIIKGNKQNEDSFSEVIVDLLDEKMVLNKEDTDHCGFVMSYTHHLGQKKPCIKYFCISDKNEKSWFQRFWS